MEAKKKTKVLHLLASGGAGGIECLCKDIARFSDNYNIFCFVFSGGIIAEEMKKDGFNVIEMNLGDSKYFMKFLWGITHVCKTKKIDVIVTHHSAPLFYIAVRYLRWRFNIEYYIYVHSNISHALLSMKCGIRSVIFQFAAHKANSIICISDFVKQGVNLRFKFLKEKTLVVYNGINLNSFENNLAQVIKHDMFTIIFVGRLVSEKSVDYLVKAINIVKENEKINCIIVGDGPEKKRLANLVECFNLEGKISFVGIQRNIVEWLKKASIFVHPSICEEGFGITLVEAMAVGVPCIAFNKGAIPEIIDDRKNGFIINEITAEALAEAINYTYEISNRNIENWDEIRLNAIARVRKFSIQTMIKKLDSVVTKGD